MQGRGEEAIGLHKRALAHNPDYAEGQMNLGNALREQGKPDEAVARYERAIALRPDYVEALSNLGNALHDLGKLGEARALLRARPRLHADFAEAAAISAMCCMRRAISMPRSTQLERAIALRPDYAEAQNGLGLVLDKKGEYDTAIACFERALALQPDDVEILNNLGAALQNRGRFDDAIARYERALALRPDYTEARKNLGGALHARAGERSGALLRERMKQAAHDGVRGQYETLPFPARDPEGERYVLYVTPPDILAKVNQYCFGGSARFRQRPARAGRRLRHRRQRHVARRAVARHAVGDRRTRSFHGEHRDCRSARDGARALECSLRQRLAARGAAARPWHVRLHHLSRRAASSARSGCRAARARSRARAGWRHGADGLWPARPRAYLCDAGIAARHDRRYRRSRAEARHRARRAAPICRRPIRSGLREGWDNIQAGYLKDDTNLWDTLLHEQDRAYTASGVRDFLAGAGLHLQAFGTYKAAPATCALQYDLDLYVSDPAERARLANLPQAQREDMAETLDGSLALHTFYATRAPSAALDPTAPEAILSVMSEFGDRALARARDTRLRPLPIVLRNGRSITYAPSPQAQRFLAAIDGQAQQCGDRAGARPIPGRDRAGAAHSDRAALAGRAPRRRHGFRAHPDARQIRAAAAAGRAGIARRGLN